MKKILVVLTLIILVSGCLYGPLQFGEAGEETEQEETQTTTTAPVETVQPKTDIQKVKDYLEEHPIEDFGEQASRIDTVDFSIKNTSLTYTISKHDPAQESWYLAGVLFLVFPSTEAVDVRGFNEEGKMFYTSRKFPKRENYAFSEEWFGIVEIASECVTPSDCNDSNECTKDGCYNGKCSNVVIVSGGCA